MAEHQTGAAATTAIAERKPTTMEIVSHDVKTPQEYADRIRELQGQAHILSPTSAVPSIAPNHVINPMVVAIDPSVDAKSGRGADVYYSPSIHKSRKDGGDYIPLEVSLNKHGLAKILAASGANVHPPRIEFRERYWWIVSHDADLLTFDGKIVRMPPGTASVDLRDGSADIGEWTPELWAEAVRVADEQKKHVSKDEQWKVKPTVNGWTKDRVIQARKFGLEMAESKSLNRLARNLGIRQSYLVKDLIKPFVIFRASYVPDQSDPVVRRMLTAVSLGARHLMYGNEADAHLSLPANATDAPISHAMGDPTNVVDVSETTHEHETMATAAPPEDAEELVDEPVKQDPPAEQKSAAAQTDTFHITKVLKRGKDADAQYFAETKEGVTLYTPDASFVKPMQLAVKDGKPREIPTERVAVKGETYRQIVEITAAGGLKL